MKNYKVLFSLLALFAAMLPFFGKGRAEAQAFSPQFALSANLGTLLSGAVSVEASAGFSRHWSVDASARYNPLIEDYLQRSFAIGGRFWPWYIYSGFWLSGKARYQEYREATGSSSLWNNPVESLSESLSGEGDRYGGSLSLGYSRMIGKHFNIDFGIGLWGGFETYAVYECGSCGRIKERGEKYFLRADEWVLALTYVF